MINISIDDKACVSCSLCVDICPTKVFTFDNEKDIPEVTQLNECFGCLSCSEICPSDAIHHDRIERSKCFYHDPYALRVAYRLATTYPVRFDVITDKTVSDHALRDLSVRLLSVGAVLKDVVGAGLPSVGLMAGRSLATQLPRYKPPKNLSEALDLAVQEFAPAWELSFSQDDENSVRVEIGGCFVRELCNSENIPLGGELCILFYSYLAGYLGKMSKTQLKLSSADRNKEKCSYDLKVLK